MSTRHIPLHPVAHDVRASSPLETTSIAPAAQGMYDPSAEHDACGVGFVVDMKGRRSHEIVRKALRVLMQPGASRRMWV